MSWFHEIEGQPIVPRVIGADLSPYPYISGYGLVQRIARFALPTGGELAALGLKNRKGLDVLLATQRAGKTRSTLLGALGLDATSVSNYWTPDTWSPMDCPELFNRHSRPLRQCWECACHGYHCALFQLPSVRRCPWHGSPLTCTCPSCGATQFARFNEKDQLGICRCGYTAADARIALAEMRTFPAVQCAAWTEDYLAWATRERRHRVISVPESNQRWDEAFATLAALPTMLQSTESAPTTAQLMCFEGAGPDPAPDALWGWSLLGGSQTFRSAPLPRFAFQALAKVTQSVLKNCGCNDDVVAFDGSLNRDPAYETDATPKSGYILIAPYGLSENGHAWLNLNVIDKEVTTACGMALSLTACRLIGPPDTHMSPQASIGRSLGQVVGRRHIVDAMMASLCRGYAQGLTLVLQPSWSGEQLKPLRLEVPLIELTICSGGLDRVRIAWAPSSAIQRSSTPQEHAAPMPTKKSKSKKRKSRARRVIPR